MFLMVILLDFLIYIWCPYPILYSDTSHAIIDGIYLKKTFGIEVSLRIRSYRKRFQQEGKTALL